MRAIGIRELKNRLSHYVRLVRTGESVLVTDRGSVVAELRPAGSTTQPMVSAEGLAELARRGEATPGGAHDAALYAPRPRVLDPGQLETLLNAERAE
jgi:prevent-host-death family protein